MAKVSKSTKAANRSQPKLAISNTAANMISSLFGRDSANFNAAIANINSNVNDPDKIKSVPGYENMFVARGHGLQVIFTRTADSLMIKSVAAEQ